MKNFIILFKEKEGTTAQIDILKNIPQLSIVLRADGDREPFDQHACGYMPASTVDECLDLIYGSDEIDMQRLNRLYTQTADQALAPIERKDAVGFKMRFAPPMRRSAMTSTRRKILRFAYKRRITKNLARNNVIVFMAVRQDLLRWGLSKYHGDGSGQPGHLQFKLESGEITQQDLNKIFVDCDRLAGIIKDCEKKYAQKRKLADRFAKHGLQVHPLRYENFLNDPKAHIMGLCDVLDVGVTEEQVQQALDIGTKMKKVHSNDIADFVINHEEVLERFGDRYAAW